MEASEIEDLMRDVLSERKSANKVGDLISILNVEGDANEIKTVLCGLTKFFTKEFKEYSSMRRRSMSEDMHTYVEWWKGQQADFWDSIIPLFCHAEINVQEQCILTAVQMIQNEIRCYSTDDNFHFPEVSVGKFLRGILNNDTEITEVFCKALELADLRYFVLKLFPKCLSKLLVLRQKEQAILRKAFMVLKVISESIPNDMIAGDTLSLARNGVTAVMPVAEMEGSLTSLPKTIPKAVDIKELRRAFGNAWLEFLRYDIDSHLCKSVLVILQKHVIPNFSTPCLLSDFLTRSFSQGGGIALLSLHGVFVLMTEHNLDYPQFYLRLYNMIHPRIFDTKYQSRFFFLLDVFLSSSHLPSYLVAAFAKKLARLTLVAPTYAQQLLVNFILNLIERHPVIKVLINRKNIVQHRPLSDNDPYVASQTDPAQCKAMDSSLWELSALRHHYLSSVAAYVKEIDIGPKQEILDQLEDTYEDILLSLGEIESTDVPLNHKPPEGLFGGFEDAVADLWSL